ncbi:MAG TPA: TonB-dependent receptor [bacterium]|nr:TonB-dependent receptor [bacterium]
MPAFSAASRAFAVAFVAGSCLLPRVTRAEEAPVAPLLASSSGVAAPSSTPREAGPQSLDVVADRPRNAASRQDVLDRDFLLRPHPRPADILSVVPGLFVVQHAGGGKANQYFLRGFDADHGTDIAFFLDGVPVNFPTHGHGQGFSDLHFLIPETVERIELYKGPYYASLGDFDTAGAVNLVTHRSLNYNAQSFGGGMFNTYRSLTVISPDAPAWRPFLAAEVYGTDGPFVHPEKLQRFNLFAKVTHDFSDSSWFSLAATSYASGWNASGQIPARAVEEGLISRFGSIDPSEGGSTQRHSLYATFHSTLPDGAEVDVLGYAISYRFSLFSDFTFFASDPVHGDEINQTDARTVVGTRGSYRFLRMAGDVPFVTTFGYWVRQDLISNGLYHAQNRERLAALVDANVAETSTAFYAEEQVVPTSWMRAVAGLRVDYFDFDVADRLESYATTGDATSGVRKASQLSPKLSLVLTPHPSTELYLNYGRGYHSNDARGVVHEVDPVTPLTRADGYEVGARTRQLDRLDLSAAAFLLDLASELVWDGDTGGTEPSGATRRYGLELTGRLQILTWLYADSDLTLTHAAYVHDAGNGNAVALAPTETFQGGISMRRGDGFYGRLGVFQIADRPATQDGFLTAKGFTRVDATAGVKKKRWAAEVAVENLTNTEWREAQFANVSRLPSETGPADCPKGTRADVENGAFVGCEDIHFTPGNPINVQGTVSLFF